jgi:hypothetical protein
LKNDEYATNDDKLHNFKRAAKMLNCSTFKALQGMKTKHDVSILDIIDKLDRGESVPFKLIEEKITDSIAYLILLEMLIREKENDIQKSIKMGVVVKKDVAILDNLYKQLMDEKQYHDLEDNNGMSD